MIVIKYELECRCPECDNYQKEKDVLFLEEEDDYDICCNECGCCLFVLNGRSF